MNLAFKGMSLFLWQNTNMNCIVPFLGQSESSPAALRMFCLDIFRTSNFKLGLTLALALSLPHSKHRGITLTFQDLPPNWGGLLEDQSATRERYSFYQNYRWTEWGKRGVLQEWHSSMSAFSVHRLIH